MGRLCIFYIFDYVSTLGLKGGFVIPTTLHRFFISNFSLFQWTCYMLFLGKSHN